MFRTPIPFVPSAASAAVEKLRNSLGTDVDAFRVRVRTDSGDRPRDCYVNVRNRVQREGKGKMQLGWAVWQHSHIFIEAEPHAVFNPEDGNPWIDCTPHDMLPDGSRVREILFLPNDNATYDFNTTDLPDNIRVPLLDDSRVSKVLSLMSQKTALMNSVPGIDVALPQSVERQVMQIDAEALGLLSEVMQSQRPTLAKGEKIGRNDLCPCGSDKKYKKCCAK